MEIHELAAVAEARLGHGEPWLEFIRHPALSVGLYVLEPGEPDRQLPHTEDEIYYVVEGRGRITVGAEAQAVGRRRSSTSRRRCPTTSTTSPSA